MSDDTPFLGVGARLKALRMAQGGATQSIWAEMHGFQRTQLNNWETGKRRIPVECAERLSDTYGLTLDWIYRGRIDGLSQTALKSLSGHLPRTRTSTSSE